MRSGKEPEIGKPNNSGKRSGAAERVTCQSEGRSPGYRFYALYDKVYGPGRAGRTPTNAARPTRVRRAWTARRSRTSRRTAWGRGWANSRNELKSKTYEPQAVKRVWLPKPNSEKLRPLGVPTITDRVVQTAALLVLDPIFEADLAPE